MNDQPLVGELAVIGLLAVVSAVGLHRLRLPSTVGFLLAGAVAGPHGAGLIASTESIGEIAELGVILLLFAIGLEFSLTRLRFIWRPVAVGGSLQVGVTTLVALAVLTALGESVERALVFGFVVALSSTVVVLRVLSARGELDAPHGRFTVGALIFQDLLVVPLTLLIPVLADGGSGRELALEVGWALTRAVLVVAAVAIVARLVVPRLFAIVDATRTREVFVIAVLSVALGSAWLMAELGLSFALGAFLAGVLLADTDYSHRAVSDVLPLRDAFTGVFFVSLGMLVDAAVFVDEPITLVLIVAALVPGKAAVAALAALAMRYPARAAWRAGVYLSQFGEFGYVVLTLGAAERLVTDDEVRLIVTAGVVSIVLSRLAMSFAHEMHAGEALLRPLERLLRVRGIDEPRPEDTALAGHVVVAGYGVAGQLLARALAEASVPYVVLELNAERVRAARRFGGRVYYGDVTSPEAVEHARLAHAQTLAIVINDPDATRRAVSAAHAACPEVPIVVRTRYLADRPELLALGASEVVCEELEGGTEVAAHVLVRLGVERSQLRQHIATALVAGRQREFTGVSEQWLTAIDES